MGLLDGASFFFMPDPSSPFGASNGICEGLTSNLMRSLQFSYMLLKGFRLTSCLLKDLEMFRDTGIGRSGGRFRWHASRSLGTSRGGRIGSCNRAGIGRCAVVRSSEGRERLRKRAGRRPRCGGDNLATRASGEENEHGNAGGNGESAGSGESKMNNGIQGENGGVANGRCANLNGAGEADFNTHGSIPNGTGIGEFRVAAESVLVSKFTSGMTNRTLSITGLGAVDGFSNHLKPMKGFMKSVKMATGVVSGVKTATGVIQKFQAPASGVLMGFGAANGVVLGFETARMIVKGAKISKDFWSAWKSSRTRIGKLSAAEKNQASKALKDRFLKGLKASDGALTLVKLTKEFATGLGGSVQGGFSQWDLITKSYDASNSVLKVFEAVLGLKGGGVVGLVGKGFVGLKGAVSGLGLSVNLVKAVVISKEVSIALLKGFGLSKTVMEAFKAIHDGKAMVKWIIYREASDASKGTGSEKLQEVQRIALLKGGAYPTMFNLLITGVQHSHSGSQDSRCSLMFSLACLLFFSRTSDHRTPDEDGISWSSSSPSNIFFLSLPLSLPG